MDVIISQKPGEPLVIVISCEWLFGFYKVLTVLSSYRSSSAFP